MAHWGVAMTYLHPLWAPPTRQELSSGAEAVARARALSPPTPLERDWVEAIGTYYQGWESTPHGARLRSYEQALGRLHRTYPDISETATFHALSLIAVAQASPRDTALALARAAAEILEPLFAAQPSHPGLAHYLIHAYDFPALAASGSRAANRYASIAPSVPHARHMPSHIYIRLGQWEANIASNISSAAAARDYEVQQRLDAVWDQRLHAMDYMVFGYLQQGRDAQAKRVVDEAAGMRRVFPEGSVVAHYALAAMPARYAMEREAWREAAGLEVRDGLAPGAAAVTRFARAVGAARAGQASQAREEVAALSAIDDTLARRQVAIWPGMVHAQRLAAEAWLHLASGDTAAAVRVATQAADLEDVTDKHPATPGAILPARELLGDMLLALGRSPEALAAYRASLAQQPGRARSLAGAARAAEAAGDRAAAQRHRQELRTLLARADRARAQSLLGAGRR
jgi:tetratricopeptide (TPR) repeat protein